MDIPWQEKFKELVSTRAMLQILKIRLMMSSSMSADMNSTWTGP